MLCYDNGDFFETKTENRNWNPTQSAGGSFDLYEKFVEKCCAKLNLNPNVMWKLINEPNQGQYSDWSNWMKRAIDVFRTNNYKGPMVVEPLAMGNSWDETSIADLKKYDSNIIISLHWYGWVNWSQTTEWLMNCKNGYCTWPNREQQK